MPAPPCLKASLTFIHLSFHPSLTAMLTCTCTDETWTECLINILLVLLVEPLCFQPCFVMIFTPPDQHSQFSTHMHLIVITPSGHSALSHVSSLIKVAIWSHIVCSHSLISCMISSASTWVSKTIPRMSSTTVLPTSSWGSDPIPN